MVRMMCMFLFFVVRMFPMFTGAVTVRTFRAVRRIMPMCIAVFAVRTVDMLRAAVRVAVRVRMDDLCIRKEFLPAGTLGETQHAVRVRSRLFDIMGDHEDRDFLIDIQMVQDVKETVHRLGVDTDGRLIEDQDPPRGHGQASRAAAVLRKARRSGTSAYQACPPVSALPPPFSYALFPGIFRIRSSYTVRS